MGLSHEQIDWLQKAESTYRYDGGELHDIALSCFVAPSRTGKSRLISEIAALAQPGDNVGEVNTITTRARRPGEDPDGYRTADEGITHEWMLDNIARHKLINFKLFETGDIYGTDRHSYTARHNMLPTIAESVPALAQVAFKTMHIIYIVRPVDEWREHLHGNLSDPKFLGRIIEAKKSLEFARNTPGLIHVVNYDDDTLLKRTAKGLMQVVTSDYDEYHSGILDDYHEGEFDTHRRDMEDHVDNLLRQAA